jgi:hypothetical protein
MIVVIPQLIYHHLSDLYVVDYRNRSNAGNKFGEPSAAVVAAPETSPSRYLRRNRIFVRKTMFWPGRGTGAGATGQQTRTCVGRNSADRLTNQHLKA